MVLQQVVKYHEARDWIQLQDQNTLTYQSLLDHCKQLEARYKQFQQAQVQGTVQLTTITAASASPSSLHANTQSTTTHLDCKRCGYSHPWANCSAYSCECYNCHNKGHFTALCRKPRTNRCQTDVKHRSSSRGRSTRSSNQRHTSRSPSRGRQLHRRRHSHNHRGNSSSCNPLTRPSQKKVNKMWKVQSSTLQVSVSHLTSFISQLQVNEGQIYTDKAPDGHLSFYMTLQLITKHFPLRLIQGQTSILYLSANIDPYSHSMFTVTEPWSPIHSGKPKLHGHGIMVKQNISLVSSQ